MTTNPAPAVHRDFARQKAAEFRARMRLPVIAAPMFLISGPELVTAACKAGIMGCFPAPQCPYD
jgi:nitronate monooxygenase